MLHKTLKFYYLLVADSIDKSLVVQAIAFITVSSIPFFITIGITRITSIFHPEFGIVITDGLRFHHFNSGMLIIELGYVALMFELKSRAKRFAWAIMYGIGQALMHDEQSMLLWLDDHDDRRWSTLGLKIWFLENLLIILVAHTIMLVQKMLKRRRDKRIATLPVSAD